MRKRKEYDRESLLRKHPRWLAKMDYRCQCLGVWAGTKKNGVYRRYNFHHTHTAAYGDEKPGWNYLLLCPLAHWFVHNFLGGAWFSDRDVTVQNSRAEKMPLPWLWRYPNPPQRLFHLWCRSPMTLRYALLAWAAIDLVWWAWTSDFSLGDLLAGR